MRRDGQLPLTTSGTWIPGVDGNLICLETGMEIHVTTFSRLSDPHDAPPRAYGVVLRHPDKIGSKTLTYGTADECRYYVKQLGKMIALDISPISTVDEVGGESDG